MKLNTNKDDKIVVENKKEGIGFCGALTLIFVIAKLMGVIEWSWWMVFLPILIPIGFVIIAMIMLFIVNSIIEKCIYK